MSRVIGVGSEVTPMLPNRRAALGLLAAALLAGCAGGPPIPPEAGRVHIGAIRVTARADNSWLQRAAPIVADQLRRQLGARYAPGERGTATMSVYLDDLQLLSNPEILGGRAGYASSVPFDSLGGTITLTAAGGRPIASWPLLANTQPIPSQTLDPYPDPSRLPSLARTFAYWVVKKLDQS